MNSALSSHNQTHSSTSNTQNTLNKKSNIGTETKDANPDYKRYSRSTLYLLRNKSRSRRRPECFLRTELQNLGVWKCNTLQNGNSFLGSESGNQQPLISFVNTSPVSSYASSNSGLHHPIQKTYIDHRSISSAHLMPAFAKRSIVIANCTSVRSESLSESKDSTNIRCQQSKERVYNSRQRNDEQSSFSPQRYLKSHNEKERYIERDIPPAASTHARQQSIVSQERRIGSGRLLPRDVNWDYHIQEKDKIIGAVKEISISQHQSQQRNSGRYNERPNNCGFLETRSLDHKSEEDSLNTGNKRNQGSNENIEYISMRHSMHGRMRRNHNERNEEPEWFSGGPTSQLDTIELRGFEDVDDNISNKYNDSKTKEEINTKVKRVTEDKHENEHDCLLAIQANKVHIEESNSMNISHNTRNIKMKTDSVLKSNDKTNNKPNNKNNLRNDDNQHTANNEDSNNNNSVNEQKNMEINTTNINTTNTISFKNMFNFDFLNINPLEHTIMHCENSKKSDVIGSSRFKQWFTTKNNEIPIEVEDSVENELKQEDKANERNLLMEFLQRNKLPQNIMSEIAQPSVLTITSVEELEARMRQTKNFNENEKSIENTDETKQIGTQIQKTETIHPETHEIEAFKKLLEQLSSDKKVKASIADVNFLEHQMNPLTCLYNVPQVNITSMPLNLPPNIPGNDDFKKIGLTQNSPPGQQQNQLEHSLAVKHSIIASQCSQQASQNLLTVIPSYVPAVFSNQSEISNFFEPQSFYQGSPLNVQSQQNTTMVQTTQHMGHGNSPTPLAFTPTSVLRKMTAEKDNSSPQQQVLVNKIHSQPIQYQQQHQKQLHQAQHHHHQSQLKTQPNLINQQQQTNFVNQQTNSILQQQAPRMILGGNQHPILPQQQIQLKNASGSTSNSSQQILLTPQQISHMKWHNHLLHQNIVINKPLGRPILKGPTPTHPQTAQQIPQITFASKIELQQIQQQRIKNNLNQPQKILSQQPSIPTFQSHHLQSHSSNLPTQASLQQIYPQHHQQQQQQRILEMQNPQQQQMQQSLQQVDNRIGNSINTLVPSSNKNSTVNYHRDGRLSPTSNQLAQWFSPELLAQATAGKLPLINMNQALSLEEFERSVQHSSTAVHN